MIKTRIIKEINFYNRNKYLEKILYKRQFKFFFWWITYKTTNTK